MSGVMLQLQASPSVSGRWQKKIISPLHDTWPARIAEELYYWGYSGTQAEKLPSWHLCSHSPLQRKDYMVKHTLASKLLPVSDTYHFHSQIMG